MDIPHNLEQVFSRIGNTPVLYFDTYKGVKIYLKLEGFNPSGSLKDRPVKKILQKLITSSNLDPNKRLLTASSGSFASALVYLGKTAGVNSTVVVTSRCTPEQEHFIKLMGGEIIKRDGPTIDSSNYCQEVLMQKEPNKYLFVDQLHDWNNPLSHYETTGPEIIDTLPDAKAIMLSTGSGATMCGISRYMAEHCPQVKILSYTAEEASTNLPGGWRRGIDYHSPFIKEVETERPIHFYGYINETQSIQRHREALSKGFFVGAQTGGVLEATYQAIDAGAVTESVVALSGDSGWKSPILF